MKASKERPPHDDETAFIKALCDALGLPREETARYFANKELPCLPSPSSQEGAVLKLLTENYGDFVSIKRLQAETDGGIVHSIVFILRGKGWPIRQAYVRPKTITNGRNLRTSAYSLSFNIRV